MANNFPQAGARKAFEQQKAQQPGQGVAVLEAVSTDIGLRIEAMKDDIEKLVYKDAYDKFKNGVALAVMRNPQLAQADRGSFMMAVKQAAHLKLDPNPDLGLVYFTPFKGQVKLLPGYQGLLEMVRRSGEVRDIKAVLVYEKDEFLVEEGSEPRIVHKPVTFGDKGAVLGAYAIAHFKDGTSKFDIVDMAYIDKVRDVSQTGRTQGGVWDKWFEEQVKKTAIRRLCKSLPKSADVTAAIQSEYDAPATETIDQETGEVLIQSSVYGDVIYPDPTPVVDIVPAKEPEDEVIHVKSEMPDQYAVIPPEPPLEAYSTNMAAEPVAPVSAGYAPVTGSYQPPKPKPTVKTKAQGTSTNLEGLFTKHP